MITEGAVLNKAKTEQPDFGGLKNSGSEGLEVDGSKDVPLTLSVLNLGKSQGHRWGTLLEHLKTLSSSVILKD